MKISSIAFISGGRIQKKYTCDGENINPPLTISEVPESAKSLVLVMEDPDAPMGTFYHWRVWNINPRITEIEENCPISNGETIEGITSAGKPGYIGPCPPSGTHRYIIKVYALNRLLDLAPQAQQTELEKAMQGNIIEQAEMMGVYSRE